MSCPQHGLKPAVGVGVHLEQPRVLVGNSQVRHQRPCAMWQPLALEYTDLDWNPSYQLVALDKGHHMSEPQFHHLLDGVDKHLPRVVVLT